MSKRSPQPAPVHRESEALFELGRASHSPSAADRARVRAALARKLSDVPPQGARLAASGKLVKLGFVAAGLIVCAFVATRGVGTKPVAPPTSAPSPHMFAPSAPAESRTEPAIAAPMLSTPAENGAQRSARAPSKRLKPKRVASDLTVDNSPVVGTAPERDNAVVAKAPAQPSAAKATDPEPRTSTPAEQPADQNTARSELAFVTRIHAALRDGQPRTALALCTEHQQRWPNGIFSQEREGLRAIASCNAAASGASTLARAFVANYPRAPLTPRVRDACDALR